MAKGIFKRKNSQNYWIRYAGIDGRIIRESSGSTKFRDAETLLIKRKQDIKEGKEPEIKRITNHTLRELAEKYAQWMQGRHRSANSKLYRIKQVLSVFGNIPLRRFSTLLVEQYQTDLINRGLKPASVNKNISILKAMFSKAVDWNMVEEETLKRVRKVKLLPENNKRLRFLSKAECQELVNACGSHLKPIVITALNTGMRKSEILNLTWEQVDLKHGFILLDRTKNGERREIPINNTLRGTLQGVTRRLDVPYVFFDPKTGKSYREVKKSFKTALRKAKITDFKFHDLRHTFASHLVMAGVDITTVKELLGHKSLTMTLRYAHLAPSHKVRAVDMLDKTFNRVSTAHLVHSKAKMEEIKQCPTAVTH
jgi:integrase